MILTTLMIKSEERYHNIQLDKQFRSENNKRYLNSILRVKTSGSDLYNTSMDNDGGKFIL